MVELAGASPGLALPLHGFASAQSHEEIARLAGRYRRLFDEIQIDLTDLVTYGRMERAVRLSETAGEHLNHNDYPAYFFGDLDASFVLIHLNPKHRDNPAPRMVGEPAIRTFADYFDAFRRFGAHQYGPDSTSRHKSSFDHKQIRFIRPFGVIDFVGDTRENLRRVVDDKLQLELVPYGSASFSGSRFPAAVLRPHFDRLMATIAAHPRQFVIFCGAVFEKLLPAGSIVEQHVFRLAKADGTQTKGRFRFANLRIEWNGQTVAAGLAHSWALQGIPMAAYADAIVARYAKPGFADSAPAMLQALGLPLPAVRATGSHSGTTVRPRSVS